MVNLSRFDDEEFMELFWPEDNITTRKSNTGGEDVATATAIGPTLEQPAPQLFMHEDEMTSWLAPYPVFGANQGYHALEPSGSNHPALFPTTVIDSNETAERQFVRASSTAAGDSITSTSTSAELPLSPPPSREDRKRKGIAHDDVRSKVRNYF